jgi:hypothetical protein
MKDEGSGIREQGTVVKGQGSGGWLAGTALILVAAAVAVGPQLVRGNSCGHDFDFHLLSWLDAQRSWRLGIAYPHWTASANYGAGEPRFVFYPPLTWMAGAALGFVLPWQLVPIALTFLMLAGTGLATRALARQFMDDGAATLAGCAALFSSYALFTAYERSAFGELTGGMWIALLLLFALRDDSGAASGSRVRGAFTGAFNAAFNRSAAMLALVVAGAWLSNAPLGVMASYLLATVAALAAVTARSWAPVLRAVVAAVLGIGLAAFFLIPADREQGWAALQLAAADPGEKIENSWMFARHADPSLAFHDQVLEHASIAAAAMLGVALISVLVCAMRRRLPGTRAWWIPLAVIPVGVLVLQLPVSLPLWNALPKLRFLQFPWRWLVVAEAPMGGFLAAAIWPVRQWARTALAAGCCALFLAMTWISASAYFQVCDEDDAVAGMLTTYRSGVGFEGTDEYAPPGADNSMVAMGLPGACLVSDPFVTLGESSGEADSAPVWDYPQRSCDEAFPPSPVRAQHGAEHFEVLAVSDHAGYWIVRVRRYPAWQVRVNGRPVGMMSQREDGLMAVPVPAGPVRLTVDWGTTPDVIAGRWVSGIAALLVTALWWSKRLRFHRGLS